MKRPAAHPVIIPAPRDRAREEHIARIERALVLAAYIVLRHGDVYAPYINRLEKELAAARADDPAARARRILEDHAKPIAAAPPQRGSGTARPALAPPRQGPRA
ncbi:hypothetical protein [Hyphomicrobium sp. MC8b]|uniref:hypothetical protein n=1 Tax=Hyphomicrobium sp. MC8b TaxID=300273 RepID=UPI00391C4CF0